MTDAALEAADAEVEAEVIEEPTKSRTRRKKPVEYHTKDRTWTIRIHENESDRSDVPVTINGRNFLLQRGVPVPGVTDAIKHVLDNAVHVQVRHETKQDGTRIETRREVPRFPYSVISVEE